MARKRRRTPATAAPIASPRAVSAQPRRDRTLALTVGAVLLVLAAVGDDRHVGLIADGRQMIRTAVALVETGGIGQAEGRDFTVNRPGGDAVSRFGMATSLLQVPAAWFAPRIEAWRGPGSSEALFLIVPWLGIGIAAAAAGGIARELGAGNLEVAAAVLLASIASPLGSYADLEFSEPVQAAALTLALWAALRATASEVPQPGLEAASGFFAGFAVLTKSSLIAAAPFALLPLLDLDRPRRSRGALARCAVGVVAPLGAWAGFEFVRFGRLFGGYPDDRFTHPWLDGLLRLLVSPNRGLILFWPALLFFFRAGLRRGQTGFSAPRTRAWLGAGLVLAAQLVVAAGYWGWHGMEGWGPRLIVSSIPLLAPFAALALAGRPLALGLTVSSCLLINAPPLLQHPTPVATYVMNLRWPAVDDAHAARLPFYATGRSSSGQPTVVPFERLEMEPSANPWRLYLWIWRASRLDDPNLATRLAEPPWRAAIPDLRPAEAWSPATARQIVPEPRPGFLGRSLTGTGGPYATVYLDALLDQVVLANQVGNVPRALELSVLRLNLRPDGEAAAWRLESLRRADRAEEAAALLRSLPEESRREPLINVVLALFDRAGGQEARARALLASVADSFPGTRVGAVLEQPLAAWPGTLDEMTRLPRRDAMVAGGGASPQK